MIRSNTYSFDSGGLSEMWCECDCHHSSLRRILDLWSKDYQDFGKFNSLRNTQSVKYESLFALAYYVDEATLRHVHIPGRNKTKKTMTCIFWYRHS